MMNIKDDILNVYPIIQKINDYPSKENKYGNESSMFLIYEKHLGDTIIYGNTDLSGNIIM